MKIGILFTVNEYSVDPANLARKMEALGFESLWVPDHAVMPVHTTTPLPETQPGQGQIPEVYSHMCDPFVAMALAAGATTRLKVATGVLLVPERNPLLTANETATLDHFSDGRVLLGIGAGWLKEESEMLGVDFPHRWTQTREYIAAMRELWTKEEASFEGKYVKFPPVRLYPKPAQKGGPPILLGSKDKNALNWVAQWGDGWCPIFVSPEATAHRSATASRRMRTAGRDLLPPRHHRHEARVARRPRHRSIRPAPVRRRRRPSLRARADRRTLDRRKLRPRTRTPRVTLRLTCRRSIDRENLNMPLDAQMKNLLDAMAAADPRIPYPHAREARKNRAAASRAPPSNPSPMSKIAATRAGGAIPVRIYTPQGPGPSAS